MNETATLLMRCFEGCGAELRGEAPNHGMLFAGLGRKRGWTRQRHPAHGIGHVHRCGACSTRRALDA